MKTINVFLIAILILSFLFLSCKGDKGEKGDMGPVGPAGPAGHTFTPLWEDFETGDFSKYPWQHSGSAYWSVTSATAFFGTQSVRSGTISHNQKSDLTIAVNLSKASLLYYYYKTSCESGYDGLIFYIDNIQRTSHSGVMSGWGLTYFVLPPGNHTLKWSYVKDGTNSAGSDCAWLDGIYISDYTTAKVSELASIAEQLNKSVNCVPLKLGTVEKKY
ncbi:MAG: hypothetical protein N3A63_03445 [Bacteroidetes bacterium]|nr:hypothetical protein [Bacteroidota bacterium]